MNFKLRNALIAVGFFFLLPVAFFASYRLGAFEIAHIEVEVLGQSEPHLNEYAHRLRKKLKRYENLQFWKVEMDEVGKMVDGEKWVKDFRVTRRFPHGLKVSVTPFRSVGNLVLESGVRPLSEMGDWLDEVSFSKAPRLPIIQGNRETLLGKGELARVLAELPLEGRVSPAQLAEVEIDKRGDLWLQHLRTSSRIRLGTENVALQAARVEKVLEYLEHNGLSGREIDADYSRKVLVKLRTASATKR